MGFFGVFIFSVNRCLPFQDYNLLSMTSVLWNIWAIKEHSHVCYYSLKTFKGSNNTNCFTIKELLILFRIFSRIRKLKLLRQHLSVQGISFFFNRNWQYYIHLYHFTVVQYYHLCVIWNCCYFTFLSMSTISYIIS